MTEKRTTPKKPSRRGKSQPSVLGSLPATRPTRLGRHAGAAGDEPAAETTAAAAPAPATPRASKSKGKATAAKSGATAAKPAKPTTRAAKPSATATKPKATAAKPKAAATKPKAPPKAPPPEEPRRPSGPPSGGEIVTTAVQAVGELTQIGLGVGARALRRAARRIRP